MKHFSTIDLHLLKLYINVSVALHCLHYLLGAFHEKKRKKNSTFADQSVRC